MSLTPDFKWAQDKETVFVTIEITDCSKPKINLTSSSLAFEGFAGEKHFQLNVDLLHEIDAEKSKFAVRSRGIELILHKKDTEAEFWPHLVQDSKKWKTHCHIDWARWVDEDEEVDPGMDWQSKMADFNPVGFPDDYELAADQNEGDDGEDDEEEGDDELPKGQAEELTS